MNVKFFDWDYLHLTALMNETYFTANSTHKRPLRILKRDGYWCKWIRNVLTKKQSRWNKLYDPNSLYCKFCDIVQRSAEDHGSNFKRPLRNKMGKYWCKCICNVLTKKTVEAE